MTLLGIILHYADGPNATPSAHVWPDPSRAYTEAHKLAVRVAPDVVSVVIVREEEVIFP